MLTVEPQPVSKGPSHAVIDVCGMSPSKAHLPLSIAQTKRQPLEAAGLVFCLQLSACSSRVTWENYMSITSLISDTGSILLPAVPQCWGDDRYWVDGTQHSSWHSVNLLGCGLCLQVFLSVVLPLRGVLDQAPALGRPDQGLSFCSAANQLHNFG